ncbi:MAG: tRNA-dihydrouridine synthase [Candidatus Endonucleobacter bathymodioli]|uniref:tRNA-dihydrouridine(16) synthase n=1 Tax=Candidatus Endonucleibacter bathymodioli TaxID=539814 RepID=A0AA90NJX6_9GAMM|nr:tRNA-dihydrouridine synthase [Candidatus Endonucleobacter bathymodioli]
MHITLAPMDGVVDYLMRALLSEVGGLDHCVTEFVRVTDTPLASSTFYRLCPELYHGCKTNNNTPVTIQLLGSNPEMMALSAQQAVMLGAKNIDLNFGCPAKTVNKHRGGAVLLTEPDHIHRIVKAVRTATPGHIPVTAKMRLGYEDKAKALDNAQAIESAGADALTVHARTKVEGYRPPAHWEWIARINECVKIPVIANGDIFTFEDAKRIQEVSGCERIMIGRGLLRNPLLALHIKTRKEQKSSQEIWNETLPILRIFINKVAGHNGSMRTGVHPYFIIDTDRYIVCRSKQWLSMMSKGSTPALMLFKKIKLLQCSKAIIKVLLTASEAEDYHQNSA